VKAHKLRNFSSFPSFQSKSCSKLLGFQRNVESTVNSGTYQRFGGTNCLSNLYWTLYVWQLQTLVTHY